MHIMNSIKMNCIYLYQNRVQWIHKVKNTVGFVIGQFFDQMNSNCSRKSCTKACVSWPRTTYLILVLSMLHSSPRNVADSMGRNNLARDQGALVPCSSYVQIFIIVATLHSIRGNLSTLSMHPWSWAALRHGPSRWRCCKDSHKTAVNNQLVKWILEIRPFQSFSTHKMRLSVTASARGTSHHHNTTIMSIVISIHVAPDYNFCGSQAGKDGTTDTEVGNIILFTRTTCAEQRAISTH
jgi:hypothetical protein